MLLHCRSFVEGARAVAMWTTLNMPIADSTRPEAATAGLLADLMTPVIKAFFTDMGFEAANTAMQCYGGHGYVRDNGVEQFVRDGRINQTYEGANGVQAMDFVGRKLGRKGGAAPMALFGLIGGWLAENAKDAKLDALHEAGEARSRHPAAGHVVAGADTASPIRTMPARARSIICASWASWSSAGCGRAWRNSRKPISTPAKATRRSTNRSSSRARYWMERMLPECPMLFERIQVGSETLMAYDDAVNQALAQRTRFICRLSDAYRVRPSVFTRPLV